MTTITITLEDELETLLKDHAAEAGMSPEDAIKDLLRLKDALIQWRDLKEDELLQGWTREELRAEIQKGLDSGEATPWSVDEFLSEAHARHKARKDKTS